MAPGALSEPPAPIYRVTVTVRGRVQGVGFRAWTVAEVNERRLPIHGEVRNLPDGAVEVIAESADRGVLESLVLLLSRGPGHAHVSAIDPMYEANVTSRHTSFRIGY